MKRPPARPIGDRMMAVACMHDLTHAECRMLSIFAYYDGPGGCYPAIGTVARHMGISVSWAKELLKSIKGKGVSDRRDDGATRACIGFSMTSPFLKSGTSRLQESS